MLPENGYRNSGVIRTIQSTATTANGLAQRAEAPDALRAPDWSPDAQADARRRRPSTAGRCCAGDAGDDEERVAAERLRQDVDQGDEQPAATVMAMTCWPACGTAC